MPYFENIRNALIRSGHTPEAAYKITWGAIRRWARGGGKVHPEVVAAAQAALADLAAKSARAHADHANEGDVVTAVELAGAWNAALHPRVAAGASNGGQFGSKAAQQPGGKKAPTPSNRHPVGRGETGKRVSDLQARLNALGAKPPLKIDGKFGPKTLAAVRAFQAAHGLKVDGLVGPKTTAALRSGSAAGKHVSAKAAAKAAGHGAAPRKAAPKKAKAATGKNAPKKMTAAQQAKADQVKAAGLRSQAARLLAQAKALDAQAAQLANDGAAVELAVKTPAPERTAGRKALAAKGQALADGTDPIPDLAYLKKAIRSKGRVDPSKWPALKALIRKRARELGALDEPGVKGTWAFEAANDAEGIELAMMTRPARVRGTGDVSCKRTAPGEVTVTHKPTGMRIGTLKPAQHGGWQGTHATGKPSPASGSMAGALSGLIGLHNKVAASAPSPEPAGSVHAMAAHEAALELAGALPYTSAATSTDGPRVTSMGGAKTTLAPAAHAVYRKLRAKGVKHGQALAMAKRAAAMRARRADPKALSGQPRHVIELVGPKGFIHGWVFVGAPGAGQAVHHPRHGKGVVTGADSGHVRVKFGSGEHSFERSGPRTGKAAIKPRENMPDYRNPETQARHDAMRQAVRNEDYDIAMQHLNQMDKLEGRAGVAEGEGMRPAIRKTASQMKLLKQGKQAEYRALPKEHEKQAQAIERTAGEVITSGGFGRASDVPERAGKVKASLAGAATALRAGDHKTAARHLGDARMAAEGNAGSRILTGGHDGRAADIRISEHEQRVQRLAGDTRDLARYAPAPKAAKTRKAA